MRNLLDTIDGVIGEVLPWQWTSKDELEGLLYSDDWVWSDGAVFRFILPGRHFITGKFYPGYRW